MTPSFIFYRIIGVYPPLYRTYYVAHFKHVRKLSNFDFNIKTNKRWLLPVLHKRKRK